MLMFFMDDSLTGETVGSKVELQDRQYLTQKIMRQLLWIVMSLWALPLTAVGGLIGVLVWVFARFTSKSTCRISTASLGRAKAVVLHGTACVAAFRVLVPWMILDGMTFGQIILMRDESIESNRDILAHELAHTGQAMLLGPFFPLTYGFASLLAFARGGHYYRDNIYEKEARSFEVRASEVEIR
jgi:hypothetical protein